MEEESIQTEEATVQETKQFKPSEEMTHQPHQEIIIQKRFYLLRDAWNFLKVRKKWWLLPILIMMGLVGILIVFGQSSAVSPFVYALF